jgi:hypothetical protein
MGLCSFVFDGIGFVFQGGLFNGGCGLDDKDQDVRLPVSLLILSAILMASTSWFSLSRSFSMFALHSKLTNVYSSC